MSVTAGPTRGALVAELAEVVGAPHEARFIVDEVLGLGLVLGQPNVPTGPLDDGAVAAARRLAERRAAGEPLQYVFGHWPFRGLDLLVDHRVLIPRPETEQVAEVALAEAGVYRLADADPGRGMGSWPSMPARAPGRWRSRWQRSWDRPAARGLGRRRQSRRTRGGGRQRGGRAGDLGDGPFLASRSPRGAGSSRCRRHCGERSTSSSPTRPTSPRRSGRGWRPRCGQSRAGALVAGPGQRRHAGAGRRGGVLEQAMDWLGRPGTAVIELAPHQASAAAELAGRLGFDEVRVEPDLAGRPRALVARAAAGGRRPGGAGTSSATKPGTRRECGPSAADRGRRCGRGGEALAANRIIAVPAVGGYCLAVRAGSPEVEAQTG